MSDLMLHSGSTHEFLSFAFAESNIVEILEVPMLGISGVFRANNFGDCLITAGGQVWTLVVNGEKDDLYVFYGLQQSEEFGGDYAIESWYDREEGFRVTQVFIDLPELGFYAPVSI